MCQFVVKNSRKSSLHVYKWIFNTKIFQFVWKLWKLVTKPLKWIFTVSKWIFKTKLAIKLLLPQELYTQFIRIRLEPSGIVVEETFQGPQQYIYCKSLHYTDYREYNNNWNPTKAYAFFSVVANCKINSCKVRGMTVFRSLVDLSTRTTDWNLLQQDCCDTFCR